MEKKYTVQGFFRDHTGKDIGIMIKDNVLRMDLDMIMEKMTGELIAKYKVHYKSGKVDVYVWDGETKVNEAHVK